MTKRGEAVAVSLAALVAVVVLSAVAWVWRQRAIDGCLDRGGSWHHRDRRCDRSADDAGTASPARDERPASAMTVDVVFDAPPPPPPGRKDPDDSRRAPPPR